MGSFLSSELQKAKLLRKLIYNLVIWFYTRIEDFVLLECLRDPTLMGHPHYYKISLIFPFLFLT